MYREDTDLANTTDVLVPRLLVKTQVLIQSEPHIVSIQTIGELVQVKQVLLEGARDSGLLTCAYECLGFIERRTARPCRWH